MWLQLRKKKNQPFVAAPPGVRGGRHFGVSSWSNAAQNLHKFAPPCANQVREKISRQPMHFWLCGNLNNPVSGREIFCCPRPHSLWRIFNFFKQLLLNTNVFVQTFMQAESFLRSREWQMYLTAIYIYTLLLLCVSTFVQSRCLSPAHTRDVSRRLALRLPPFFT